MCQQKEGSIQVSGFVLLIFFVLNILQSADLVHPSFQFIAPNYREFCETVKPVIDFFRSDINGYLNAASEAERGAPKPARTKKHKISTERPDQSDQPERPKQPDQPDQPEKSEQSEQSSGERPEKSEKSDQTDEKSRERPERPEQPDERPEIPDQPDQSDEKNGEQSDEKSGEQDELLMRHVIETYTHKKFNRKQAALPEAEPIGRLHPFIKGPDYTIAYISEVVNQDDDISIWIGHAEGQWTLFSSELAAKAGESGTNLLDIFTTFAEAICARSM